MLRSFLCPTTLAIASLTLVGCARPNGLYPVYGKLLYKGQPASGAIVRFVPHEGAAHGAAPCADAIVHSDGRFELTSTTVEAARGAPPGNYDVLVEWRDGKHAEIKQRGRKPDNRPADRLHGMYADPKKPRLHAEIKPETNRLEPFEITDVGSSPKGR